jgi:hypothetical protein
MTPGHEHEHIEGDIDTDISLEGDTAAPTSPAVSVADAPEASPVAPQAASGALPRQAKSKLSAAQLHAVERAEARARGEDPASVPLPKAPIDPMLAREYGGKPEPTPAPAPASPLTPPVTGTAIVSVSEDDECRIDKNGKKHAGGRPSLYKPEYCDIAKQLCENGATDFVLSDYFRIERRTLERWKANYPQFRLALRLGKDSYKDAQNENVRRKLYERAVGYSYGSEKVFQHKGEIVRAKTIEHMPPDVTAADKWLKAHDDEYRAATAEKGSSDGATDPLAAGSMMDLARRLAYVLGQAMMAQQEPASQVIDVERG